jgi:hypothetical protein
LIFYLTYNDSPSAVYSSQVIEVVKFISQHLQKKIVLIAFISIRNFKQNKAIIKSELSDAIVLPMVPKLKNWKRNKFLLSVFCRIYKPQAIIGRNVLATELALMMCEKKMVQRVIYDGRGAIAAEWNEYDVVSNIELQKAISELEKNAIINSDFRIAVSHALVAHWKERYNYKEGEEVIIPCTLNNLYENILLTEESIKKNKKKLGFCDSDILICYSGSIAGWQSFDHIETFLNPILNRYKNVKVVFLSPQDECIDKLKSIYPEQVIRKYVKLDEVPEYLISCDYGLLIREQSVTNIVASPVKFAEYLACGLKVIISENLGDYSNFVKQNNCGNISKISEVVKVDISEKIRLRDIALSYFTKKKFTEEYNKLF